MNILTKDESGVKTLKELIEVCALITIFHVAVASITSELFLGMASIFMGIAMMISVICTVFHATDRNDSRQQNYRKYYFQELLFANRWWSHVLYHGVMIYIYLEVCGLVYQATNIHLYDNPFDAFCINMLVMFSAVARAARIGVMIHARKWYLMEHISESNDIPS